MHVISRTGVLLLALMALSIPIGGQQYGSQPAGGPFSGVAVLNAPFAAKAVTKVQERRPDGTVSEQLVTSTYYRDSQGRVRAELDNPFGEYIVVWTPGPEIGVYYMLDPVKRTYRNAAPYFARVLFNGEGRVAVPIGKSCFRQPPAVDGASDAERLAAVNAQMASDLGVVIASHRTDQIGSIDYRLTNIQRDEPAAELFDVPADYTFVVGSKNDPLLRLEPWSSNGNCGALSR